MPQDFAEQFKTIPMSPNLGQSLERAHRFARDQAHKRVTLEHLLLALAEDPEAALILRAANIDLSQLHTDVSGYLGGLLDDMRAHGPVEPKPDADLLKVLQAAASAAQQSKRRQIDGAIVLAALVGDAKSPAAGLLKALGMTFEEAIRALQRANAQARLKPKVVTPGAVPPGKMPASPPAHAGPSAPPPETPAEPEAKAAPPSVPAAEPTPQTTAPLAEDFLAAARARIQQRSSVAAAKASNGAAAPETPPPPPPAPKGAEASTPPDLDVEGESAPVDPAETEALTHAIEAAMTAPPVPRRAEPVAAPPPPPPPASPVPQAPPPGTGPSRVPMAEGRPQPSPPAPRPAPPPPRAPGPFPGRPSPSAGDGPSLPTLAMPRPGMAPPGPPMPPPGALPNGAARVPWPEPASRPHPGRPIPHNLGEPDLATRPPPHARTAPPSRAGHGERGPLVENIPRRMRLDVPASGEVRIARERIEGLLHALSGAAQTQRGPVLARTLTVRLRAPGGGFLVEPITPETQWVESAAHLMHDDDAVWGWRIVPQRRGRSRLLLMVSARAVAPDGAGVETAPPDRVIDVRVRGGYGRAMRRWIGIVTLLCAGILIGRFGEAFVPALVAAIREMVGI